MSYTLVQHGSAISLLSSSGAITAITLPDDVTISSSRTPRFAIWKNEVVMVNAASEPLAINREASARVLVPRPPVSAPILSVVAGGTLTGSFKVKASFYVKDFFGNLLAESALGPASATVSPSSQFILAADVPVSSQTISGRRLYRTVTGPGSVYFPWIDIDGNTVTSVQNDLSDVGLQLVSAPENLGAVPDLYLITEWRGRLWGVDRRNVDILRRSGADLAYAWDVDLAFVIPQIGADLRGVTALLRRKDELGVGRYRAMHMIVGNDDDDFTPVGVKEKIGVLNQESVQVVDDIAYFLGNPFALYKWSDGGVDNISDEKVKSWFSTDTYFNRSRFQYATSTYDPVNRLVIWFLAAPGSSDNDRWISYDITAEEFYGPHKTGAFTPTCSGPLTLSDETEVPVIGSSSGFLWKPQATRTDDTATAIDLDVDSPFHAGDPPTPLIDKYFGELHLITKVLASGTLTITPKVGQLDASVGTAMTHDMTLGEETLGRLGVGGPFVQLNFRQNTVGVDCVLRGYEIEYFELGRRLP